MTLIEAAGRLGTTPDNLRGAIKRGSLKATKRGRDWVVESWAVELYRRNHLRDQTTPWVDQSYPIEWRLRVSPDGVVTLSGMVNVSEGGGPFAEGDSVEAILTQLREHMARIAETWTDIEVPAEAS